jgi:hypothetical protein
MSSVVISGDTSGAITIVAPTTAGTSTLTLPTGASGTITAQGVSTNIVRGTSVAASGASIDFTGIPSWVRRVTIVLDVVSQNTATSPALLFQLGTSGGIVSTGYLALGSTNGGSNTLSTTGFTLRGPSGANALFSGIFTFVSFGSNTWIHTSYNVDTTNTQYSAGGGKLALGGTLDRVRIVANGGSFNGGNINILWE